jgi:pimeloyl-ACP methyl ester carboxylesterase
LSGPSHSSGGLAYEVAGDGPAVILVHAGIADRSMWEPQWAPWAQQFTLLRYDQRGFGDSPDPQVPFARHADVLEVMDAAGIERAAVVGASMGGRAAIDLALDAPDRVHSLVTACSTPSGWSHDQSLLDAWRDVDAAYESGGVDAANEVEMRMWADGPQRAPRSSDPAFRAHVARMNHAALQREEARERAGAQIDELELAPPAIERLGELSLPLLVVTGELDQPSVCAGAAAVAAGARNAATAEIAGAAHLPSLERPQEFDRCVLGFLREHPPHV